MVDQGKGNFHLWPGGQVCWRCWLECAAHAQWWIQHSLPPLASSSSIWRRKKQSSHPFLSYSSHWCFIKPPHQLPSSHLSLFRIWRVGEGTVERWTTHTNPLPKAIASVGHMDGPALPIFLVSLSEWMSLNRDPLQAVHNCWCWPWMCIAF